MSQKIKWYNWTGHPYWNDYCKYAWIFILCPCFLLLGFIIAVAVL